MRIGNSSVGRQLLSLLLAAIGVIMVLVSKDLPRGWPESIASNLGLAVLIAGTVNCVHEKLFRRQEAEELAEGVAERVQRQLQPVLEGVRSLVAQQSEGLGSLVVRQSEGLRGLIDRQAKGLRWLTDNRRDCEEYYTWPFAHDTKELFFAGVSVLHRMDAGLRRAGIGSLEGELMRKLQEGTDIRVLFLDPRSNLIKSIALNEGRDASEILRDIATTVDICQRLYLLLEQLKEKPRSSLFVGVHDGSPCFSYHKEDEKVIVGFYITTQVERQNAAFEVLDPHTKDLFGKYIEHIQSKAKPLLTLVGTLSGEPTLYDTAYHEIREKLASGLAKVEPVELASHSVPRVNYGPQPPAVAPAGAPQSDEGDGDAR